MIKKLITPAIILVLQGLHVTSLILFYSEVFYKIDHEAAINFLDSWLLTGAFIILLSLLVIFINLFKWYNFIIIIYDLFLILFYLFKMNWKPGAML
ncbi:MAG: hypothetical protein H7296_07125 [Bacteroidia bacterium]|nr:hypothetical protein [Bacteroidia bacterium]